MIAWATLKDKDNRMDDPDFPFWLCSRLKILQRWYQAQFIKTIRDKKFDPESAPSWWKEISD